METGEITDEEINAQLAPDDDLGPEGEEDEQPAPEPEPEPEEPPTDQVMEDNYRKIQSAAKSYSTSVGRIMGDHAIDLLICPLCGPSATPAFVNKHDAGRVPDEVKSVVLAFLGFSQEQDYEHDPTTETCRVCSGKGLTATGSKVINNETRTCANCAGYGYYPPPGAGTPSNGSVDVLHAPVGQTLAALDAPEVDISGEPRILPDGRPNPNYGLWPQYKVQVPPWGVTAGLTAQDVAA